MITTSISFGRFLFLRIVNLPNDRFTILFGPLIWAKSHFTVKYPDIQIREDPREREKKTFDTNYQTIVVNVFIILFGTFHLH